MILHGIDPNLITFVLSWTKSTIETTGETVTWINDSLKKGSISPETAIRLMQEFTGVQVVEEEISLIAKGLAARAKIESASKPNQQNKPGKTQVQSYTRRDDLHLNGHAKHPRDYEMDDSEIQDLIPVG